MLEPLQAPPWPGQPKTSSEYITLIAHYYRAEIARMSGWRDRIDRTTNWAITVAGEQAAEPPHREQAADPALALLRHP